MNCATDQELADAAAYTPGRRCVYTHQVAALFCVKWRHDVISKIRLRQSMRYYLKNIPVEFHPDPIWNDRVVGFLKTVSPNEKRVQKFTS